MYFNNTSMKFTEYPVLGIRKGQLKDISWVPTLIWFLRNIVNKFSASALQSVRGQAFPIQYRLFISPDHTGFWSTM